MLNERINTYAALVNIQEPNFLISVHSQFYTSLKPLIFVSLREVTQFRHWIIRKKN